MRGLKSVLTLLLLVNWFTCSARCELERMTSGNLPVCCDDSDAAHHTDGAPTDSDQCACSGMKSGIDSSQKNPHLLLAPQVTFITTALLAELNEPRSLSAPLELVFSPPELPKSWQFSARTALAPRAPSILV